MSNTIRKQPYNERVRGCKSRTRAAVKRETFAIVNEEMN